MHQVNIRAPLHPYCRFSDVKQSDGTSIERQLALAHQWAKKNGLPIDQRNVMLDKGLSGYTKKNLTSGELGKFLDRLREGEVKTPCYLWVEDLDRLTRAGGLEGLLLLKELTDLGVMVVNGKNEQVITRASLQKDMAVQFGSLINFQRGNDESDQKSIRVTGSIREKVKAYAAGTYDFAKSGQIGLGSHPYWIKWDDETRKYSIPKDKEKAVRLILDLYRQGFGAVVIAQKLKAKGITRLADPRKDRATGEDKLAKSLTRVIRMTITMRALMGERTVTLGARRAKESGDQSIVENYVLPNYYPALLTPEEFDALQHQHGQRRTSGLKGDLVAVLTGTRVCYCGHCGRPMTGQNQMSRITAERARTGKPQPGQRRIMCASYTSATACPHRGTVQAHLLENAIFECCSDEFNLAHLMKIDARHDGIVARAAAIRVEIAKLERERNRLMKWARDEDDDAVADDYQRQQRALVIDIAKKNKQAEALEFDARELEGVSESTTADVWRSLIAGINDLDTDVRTTARKLVADTFERIEIFNGGYDAANPRIVDVELVSKRGGMISLQIDRETESATAKLVTRKKKAASKAAA